MAKLLEFLKRAGQPLLCLVFLAAGALAIKTAIDQRKPAGRETAGPIARAVRIVPAMRMSVRPWARAFGVVSPRESWRAVSEVNARVIWLDPRVRDGALIAKGTKLLELDRTELELVKKQTLARIAQLGAQRARLGIQQKNDRSKLAIEQRSLELAGVELARQKELRAKGTVPRKAVDTAEQNQLAAAGRVQALQGALQLMPAQLAEVTASEEVEQARLAQTELDLAKTVITAPFNGRAWAVAIEKAQFVRAGEVLLRLDGIAVAEVNARVGVDRLLPLMRTLEGDTAVAIPTPQRLAARRGGLEARVRLKVEPMTFDWPAQVDRFAEGLDPKTRTVGMVCTVDKPYLETTKGQTRPPLAKGMFVEVLVRTKKGVDGIVVPRSAIHDGHVRVDRDGKLAIVPVRILFVLGELAMVHGVDEGARVLATDVVPAVPGMALAGEIDQALVERLTLLAKDGPR